MVNALNTVVLINNQIIQIQQSIKLVERFVGYKHNTVEELKSRLPKTNPDSSKVEDLNHTPPDFKSSAKPLSHAAYEGGRIIYSKYDITMVHLLLLLPL